MSNRGSAKALNVTLMSLEMFTRYHKLFENYQVIFYVFWFSQGSPSFPQIYFLRVMNLKTTNYGGMIKTR